jgi:hypothetical protein
MTPIERNSTNSTRIARLASALIGVLVLLGLLTAIAVSRVPMRGAELFGALANKIKGNPGATAFVVFTALGLLWLGIGLFAAVQEWLAACRTSPNQLPKK